MVNVEAHIKGQCQHQRSKLKSKVNVSFKGKMPASKVKCQLQRSMSASKVNANIKGQCQHKRSTSKPKVNVNIKIKGQR